MRAIGQDVKAALVRGEAIARQKLVGFPVLVEQYEHQQQEERHAEARGGKEGGEIAERVPFYESGRVPTCAECCRDTVMDGIDK